MALQWQAPKVGLASCGDAPQHYSAPHNVCLPAPSSPSPGSAAQTSRCGPAAQAADEPLGDSPSCHFLCVARGSLDPCWKPACACPAAGVGALGVLCSITPSGRGPPASPPPPATFCDASLRRQLAQGRQDVCSPAWQEPKRPLRARHVVPIRQCSAPGALRNTSL